ncbi:Metallo-dependent phosphatase, partial [Coccomyxa subellipsoidea C-169]
TAMRIWAVSDVHADYKENMEWCETLSENAYQEDTLILAGDISDDQAILRSTFELMVRKFEHVFFVPGNHDLWVRRKERGVLDSLGKLEVIKDLCRELGVHTEPARIGGVWIAPIYSWYHASFDREPDLRGAPAVMVDFHACRWPSSIPTSHDTSIAEYFDNLNEPALSNLAENLEMEEEESGSRSPLLTFSHFLPLQSLLPEKRMLFQPNLAKAVGSDYIQRRIEELRPMAHIFGHTHFAWDTVVDGVRYVQWPLAYPQERKRRHDGGKGFKPLVIYDTAQNKLSPHQHTYWADFYQENRRDPSNIEPAPWVKAR